MSADDLVDFLESKSLIGFQLDASHLHNVLHGILRNQQSASQAQVAVARRLQAVEAAIQEVADRQSLLESQVAKVGGNGDEVRSLRSHLQDVSTVVENLSRQAVPEIRRSCDELRRAVAPLERNVQQLSVALPQFETANQQVMQHVDDISKEIALAQRQLAQQAASQQQVIEDRDRETIRISEVVRDLQVRAERVERGGGVNSQWRDAFEELNGRTNENFRQIEVSAKAVDAELHRIRTDLANVRTELNQMDNNSRQKMVKITDDMDNKFDMVLNLLQSYEKNSSELEEHLAAAGRALANSRAQQQLQQGIGSGYPRATTTTTTSALRGNTLVSDVRRNIGGDLSDPRSARGLSTGGLGGY